MLIDKWLTFVFVFVFIDRHEDEICCANIYFRFRVIGVFSSSDVLRVRTLLASRAVGPAQVFRSRYHDQHRLGTKPVFHSPCDNDWLDRVGGCTLCVDTSFGFRSRSTSGAEGVKNFLVFTIPIANSCILSELLALRDRMKRNRSEIFMHSLSSVALGAPTRLRRRA